jgi:hypothetical protein
MQAHIVAKLIAYDILKNLEKIEEYDNDNHNVIFGHSYGKNKLFKLSKNKIKENTMDIPKLAPILVGYYLPKNNKETGNITFTLTISDEVCDIIMKPGEFSFAIDNLFYLPIMSLQFRQISIKKISGDIDLSDVELVYATAVDNDLRRRFGMSCFEICVPSKNKTLFIAVGMADLCDRNIDKHDGSPLIPNMKNLIQDLIKNSAIDSMLKELEICDHLNKECTCLNENF